MHSRVCAPATEGHGRRGRALAAHRFANRVFARCAAALACSAVMAALSQPVGWGAAVQARIDNYVERERQASGIPGIALAIVHPDQTVHLRGFGHDGRGKPVSADTPFPIGSLSKSFTALLVRQAIESGRLAADAPVQRYLPWFRVADAQASARITPRHLLNQTSGLSRADGMAPLLQGSMASTEELARGLSTVSLAHPVGERFEYSNLNFVVLGALLQAVTGQSWQESIDGRVLLPLAMSHSFTDRDAARQAGMTAVHRMWFGVPIAQQLVLPPGYAAAGGLVSSASDLARYLQMLLAGGVAPGGRVLSEEGVMQLLAPASPPGHSTLLSADFAFRYGEGWFVGPFGVANGARWHLGNLASFAAWMVLLPETRQAVVVLINANSELPINEVNAVISRVPIGVVNLLHGRPPPQGPSLCRAYLPFDAASLLAIALLAALTWRAARARHPGWSVATMLIAVALVAAVHAAGLTLTTFADFAPDLAVVVDLALVLSCLPALWRAAAWMQRFARDGRDARRA